MNGLIIYDLLEKKLFITIKFNQYFFFLFFSFQLIPGGEYLLIQLLLLLT